MKYTKVDKIADMLESSSLGFEVVRRRDNLGCVTAIHPKLPEPLELYSVADAREALSSILQGKQVTIESPKAKTATKGYKHGATSGYTQGCRCEDCKTAMRAYSKDYNLKKKKAN